MSFGMMTGLPKPMLDRIQWQQVRSRKAATWNRRIAGIGLTARFRLIAVISTPRGTEGMVL